MAKLAGRETSCSDGSSRGRGRERHAGDEGTFLSLSDPRGGKGGFPGALETCRVTCWAPVCVSISICDCSQLQGKALRIAAWGCAICRRHSRCPCARCLRLPAAAWPLFHSSPGEFGCWSLGEPSPSRGSRLSIPRAGQERSEVRALNDPFGNGEVCSFPVRTSLV